MHSRRQRGKPDPGARDCGSVLERNEAKHVFPIPPAHNGDGLLA